MPLIYVNSASTDQIIQIPDDTVNNGTPADADVTTWTLPSGISDPEAVAIDGNGNTWVADSSSDKIYRLTLPNGGGTATIAQTINLPSNISNPRGMAFDSNDNLYVCDDLDDDIYRIALSSLTFTNNIASPANDDFDVIALPSDIDNPYALAFDSSDILYISDTTDDDIYRIALSSLTFTNGTANPSNSDFDVILLPSAISLPQGITVDNNGNLYIADIIDDDIYVVLANTADGTTATIQRQWNLPSTTTSATGLAFLSDTATYTLSTDDTDIRAGETGVEIDVVSDVDDSGLTQSDFSITNGTITGFSVTDEQNAVLTVTAGSAGTMTVTLAENAGTVGNAETSQSFTVNAANLVVTISGTTNIQQGAQTVLTASVTENGNTPAGTLVYAWAASQGRFVSGADTASATYEADFTDANDVDVDITCTVTRAADATPTVSTASLTAMTELGITGQILNMYIDETEASSNGSNKVIYAAGSADSSLADGSDDDITNAINTWRVQYHAGNDWLILNNDGSGDLDGFFRNNTTQSVYLIFFDGDHFEITNARYNNGGAGWCRWDVTGIPALATKLDNIGADDTLLVGVGDADSIGIDAGFGIDTETVTATAEVNNAPEFAQDSYAYTDVALAVGTVIATITATDADSDTLSYSLSGADASTFDVDSGTGEITVAAALTYSQAYSFTIQASDGTDTDTATVSVTAVANTAPEFAQASYTFDDVAVAVSTVVATITATDADSDTLSYSLNGTDASRFSIDADGEITVSTALRYGQAYTFNVRADDGTDTTDVGVTVNTPALAATTLEIVSGNNQSAQVSTALANALIVQVNDQNGDAFSGATVTFSTTDGTLSETSVDTGSNGQASTSLTLPSTTGDVTVTASVSGLTDVTFTATATAAPPPPNNPPEFAEASYTFDDADIADGATVGTVSATDDDMDTLSYSLTGTDASRFDISSSGVITNAELQEYGEAYTFNVVADDGMDTTSVGVTVNTETVVPRAPTIAEDSVTDTSVTITITAGNDGGSAVTDWEYELDDDGTWNSFGDTDLQQTIDNLSPETDYDIRTRGVNAEGNGLESAALSVTTDATPTVVETQYQDTYNANLGYNVLPESLGALKRINANGTVTSLGNLWYEGERAYNQALTRALSIDGELHVVMGYGNPSELLKYNSLASKAENFVHIRYGTNLQFLLPTFQPSGNIYSEIANIARKIGAIVSFNNNLISVNDRRKPRAQVNGTLTASATTLAFEDANRTFPGSGNLRIGTEFLSYTGISSGSFTGVTRGVLGTDAASHADEAGILFVDALLPAADILSIARNIDTTRYFNKIQDGNDVFEVSDETGIDTYNEQPYTLDLGLTRNENAWIETMFNQYLSELKTLGKQLKLTLVAGKTTNALDVGQVIGIVDRSRTETLRIDSITYSQQRVNISARTVI